jgi:alpha-tubulin suppressor-like RCC1 family protein
MSGQLGAGTMDNVLEPADVRRASGVAAIAAGTGHTCALTTKGGVKCWGRSVSGERGDGSTHERRDPTDVKGLTSGVAAIAAGDQHTCALTTKGAVKCWGWNSCRQLGDGTAENRLVSTDVKGFGSGIGRH